MSEFDEYLLSHHTSNPSPKPPPKYIVIDSDDQHTEQISITLTNNSGKVLSCMDTNVTQSRTDKNDNRRKGTGVGIINQHIRDRKEQKNKAEEMRLQINKMQSQCQALQLLIEKVIKQEAELEVRKYNLLKTNSRYTDKNLQPKQVSKSGRHPPAPKAQRKRRQSHLSECLDINKTIKTFKSTVR